MGYTSSAAGRDGESFSAHQYYIIHTCTLVRIIRVFQFGAPSNIVLEEIDLPEVLYYEGVTLSAPELIPAVVVRSRSLDRSQCRLHGLENTLRVSLPPIHVHFCKFHIFHSRPFELVCDGAASSATHCSSLLPSSAVTGGPMRNLQLANSSDCLD